MNQFRQAQNEAAPEKTNTLMFGIITILIGIVIFQIALLTASLNTELLGDSSVVWPSFYASLALFFAGCWVLYYLPDPRKADSKTPVPAPAVAQTSSGDFNNRPLAWRTLVISVVSLTLAFVVWFIWSAVAVKLTPAGFDITQSQKFWLVAMPVILGSFLRVPYGLMVSRFGSRNSYAFVTLLMIIPCLATGYVLRNPETPYWMLFAASTLTGIAGANFSTSMGVVSLWFPKRMQGSVLGINGLGNIGVTVAQFSIPAILGFSIIGGLWGDPLSFISKTGEVSAIYLSNAALFWVPWIILCTVAIWFWTENFPQKPKTFISQLIVCKDRQTWLLSYLYFLTFGAFVAMGASLPLIIKEVFSEAPGGAPNPLFYAPFAVLVATLARPIGGSLSDKFGAGLITALAIGSMAVSALALTYFLEPESFTGFFTVIMILCTAAGVGNGSIFKIVPTVSGPERASAMIGIVSCIGAFGGFFPPLILSWCIAQWGSPALAYVAMSLFAISCFVINAWFYWRKKSSSHC